MEIATLVAIFTPGLLVSLSGTPYIQLLIFRGRMYILSMSLSLVGSSRDLSKSE